MLLFGYPAHASLKEREGSKAKCRLISRFPNSQIINSSGEKLTCFFSRNWPIHTYVSSSCRSRSVQSFQYCAVWGECDSFVADKLTTDRVLMWEFTISSGFFAVRGQRSFIFPSPRFHESKTSVQYHSLWIEPVPHAEINYAHLSERCESGGQRHRHDRHLSHGFGVRLTGRLEGRGLRGRFRGLLCLCPLGLWWNSQSGKDVEQAWKANLRLRQRTQLFGIHFCLRF